MNINSKNFLSNSYQSFYHCIESKKMQWATKFLIISGISAIALSIIPAVSGTWVPLVMGTVTIIGIVSIPIVFFHKMNVESFKVMIIANTILLNGTLIGLLSRFTLYQGSIFLELWSRSEWLDAARRIAFTVPALYYLIPVSILLIRFSYKLSCCDEFLKNKIELSRVYVKEVLPYYLKQLDNSGFFPVSNVLSLPFILNNDPEDKARELVSYVSMIPNLKKSFIKLIIGSLKNDEFEDFLHHFSESLRSVFEDRLVNFKEVFSGKFGQATYAKFQSIQEEFPHLINQLKITTNHEELETILTQVSTNYLTLTGLIRLFYQCMDPMDVKMDPMDEKRVTFENLLNLGNKVLKKKKSLVDKFMKEFLQNLENAYESLKQRVIEEVKILDDGGQLSEEEISKIDHDFVQLRPEITNFYVLAIKLSKIDLIENSKAAQIKHLHSQFFDVNAKGDTLAEKIQRLNSVLLSNQEKEEEYVPLIYLSTKYAFNVTDYDFIQDYLHCNDCDKINGMLNDMKLDTKQKMRAFCDKVISTIDMSAIKNTNYFSEENIRSIGTTHHMLPHECFNLIKNFSMDELYREFSNAIVKAEIRQALCELLEIFQGKTSFTSRLRALEIKVSRAIYRMFRYGLLLVPTFVDPISATLGWSIGISYAVLVRFGNFQRNASLEGILSTLYNFEIFGLNEPTRITAERFVEGNLKARIVLIIKPIFLTLYTLKIKLLSFSRSFVAGQEFVLGSA